MRLSSQTEYAFLALLYLARLEVGARAHGDAIASAQEIPKGFLQQILFKLKKAKLVVSVKGTKGGYALNRRPSEISLAEVVRLFDGPLAPSRSVSLFFHEVTPITREKKVTKFLREIRDELAKRLENTHLSDLV
jgi:Rrf2 family cysteine metabolism transcriptional repressor